MHRPVVLQSAYSLADFRALRVYLEFILHSKYIYLPEISNDRIKSGKPYMNQGVNTPLTALAALQKRLVRYRDLRPCTTAFIDTRTPGSAEKENFTIIGPGVAENPDQHVHIDIPHGFNIGAARQPPGCINSQHSHETAEVFVVHAGRWAFILGPNREDGEIILEPGDTISIPVNVFRGFKNVGNDVGFLFAVLGGDDPGHVTWAPYVFEAAAEYGLVLLEDGSLVDTARGEQIPDGKKAMPATTAEEVAKHRRPSADELSDCVVARAEISLESAATPQLPELHEFPIIGNANPDEHIAASKLSWRHGFCLRHVSIKPGDATQKHVRSDEEVIFLHAGQMTIETPDGDINLQPGDTFTTPPGMPRRFVNDGADTASAYLVRGGDQPSAPELIG